MKENLWAKVCAGKLLKVRCKGWLETKSFRSFSKSAKIYLTIIFFQTEHLHICYKIFFFFNTHRKNKNTPLRSQHTTTCCQEWNPVCTFCVMLLLQKKFSERVNIVKLLSILQEIFNLVNFNCKLH